MENHAQLEGGNVAERLRSTIAYGWVERCSGVAGCGRVLHKISNLVYFTSTILFTVNECDEHVECLYERMIASTVYDRQLHLCMFYFNAFCLSIFMKAHVHGALSLDG